MNWCQVQEEPRNPPLLAKPETHWQKEFSRQTAVSSSIRRRPAADPQTHSTNW